MYCTRHRHLVPSIHAGLESDLSCSADLHYYTQASVKPLRQRSTVQDTARVLPGSRGNLCLVSRGFTVSRGLGMFVAVSLRLRNGLRARKSLSPLMPCLGIQPGRGKQAGCQATN